MTESKRMELEAENDRLRGRRPGTPDAPTDEAQLSISNKLIAERMKSERERVEELEAKVDRLTSRGFEDLHYENEQLQRKYEALVEGINSAQSHTAEALRLLQWDQLGWDVPEEVIESLGKVDSELRALLEQEEGDG